MTQSVLGLAAAAMAVLCTVLAVFLIRVPSERALANRFLAGFLLLTAIEVTAWLWVTDQNDSLTLNALRNALGNAQMAIFLGFFMASCYSDFSLRRVHLLHLLPLGLSLVLVLPGNQIPFVASGFSSATLNLSGPEHTFFQLSAHALYYGYMAFIAWTLFRFRRLFQQQHSGARSETLIWLGQLAAASFFAHTLIFGRDLLRPVLPETLVSTLQVASALIALGITSWIALTSLLQPSLFRSVDRRLVWLATPKSAGASDETERLLAYMRDEQPYLNPDLSLASLADQLAMVPRDLSELVNQSQGVHFFDFVNRYRVEYAQRLLVASPAKLVTEVFQDAGFNSKSSFNAAFRKHAGTTPSAYRKQRQAGQVS